MNDAPKTHEGGCFCGAIRFEIIGEPLYSGHCHCRSCQHALGGAFASWSKVESSNFRWTKGQIKLCETSPGVERGFCGDCGTSLTYQAQILVDGQDWSADAWFATAALDEPSIAQPKGHIYVSHQQPWLKFDDGLPTFEEF